MAIVETRPARMTPTVLLSQSLGPLTGRSKNMWPGKTGHLARNKTTPVCSKTERRCQTVHKLESLNRVLKRMFCAVLFRAFSYDVTHVCLLSNNSSTPGFARHCIATPNAKIGVRTPGTGVYTNFSQQIDSAHRELRSKKNEVAAVTKRINCLHSTKKKAEARIVALVRSQSDLY